jgi:hypothetical protein
MSQGWRRVLALAAFAVAAVAAPVVRGDDGDDAALVIDVAPLSGVIIDSSHSNATADEAAAQVAAYASMPGCRAVWQEGCGDHPDPRPHAVEGGEQPDFSSVAGVEHASTSY